MRTTRLIKSLKTAAILVAVLGSSCAESRGSSIRGGAVLSPPELASLEQSSVKNGHTPDLTEEAMMIATSDRKQARVNADLFLDKGQFLLSANVMSTALLGRPIAGVVGHHVLTSDLIARFFKELHASRPDVTRFIILSPDHFKQGTDAISVGAFDYATNGRTISVDSEAVAQVESFGATLGSRAMMEREHGIGALIPFIAREYKTDFTVVPIAIRADVNRDRIKAFGADLASLLDDHTFVIVSSDMSHYLPEAIALKNDIATETWLSNRDSNAMSRASDDYTDNGPAFVALFSLLASKKLELSFQRIDHTISSRYGGSLEYTTSYINGVWSTR